MKKTFWNGFQMGIIALYVAVFYCPALVGCTKAQRAVVRSVVDLVDEVCGDNDSVDDCLGKAQAKRASMRHVPAAAADAGAGD